MHGEKICPLTGQGPGRHAKMKVSCIYTLHAWYAQIHDTTRACLSRDIVKTKRPPHSVYYTLNAYYLHINVHVSLHKGLPMIFKP